jgi:cytoskeletal protein RodZ
MAKRGGMMQAFRNLWRLLIWGFAAVFAVAIYLNYTSEPEDEVAALPSDATAPEQPAAVEESAVTEEASPATEEVASEAADGSESATEEVADGEPVAAEVATEEAADEPAAAVEEAAEGAAPGLAEALLREIKVPGDDATYTLRNAFRHDDGSMEVTTERTTPDGVTVTVTQLVTCAPLAVGVIAEGDGARIDTPEMERIPLGTAEATIAAVACGTLK